MRATLSLVRGRVVVLGLVLSGCPFAIGSPIVTSGSAGADADGSSTSTASVTGDPSETDTAESGTMGGCTAPTHRLMERLDRGAIAVVRPEVEGGVYIGWRLLADDPPETAFVLYRNGMPLDTGGPITTSTNYLDAEGRSGDVYQVAAIVDEEEITRDAARSLVQNFLVVPLETPPNHVPGDGSVGNLDDDLEYELVIKQERIEDPVGEMIVRGTMLEGYELDGELLWRIDLGPNVGDGYNITQFLVYDFDADGVAEVVTRVANGAVDALGTTIGDPDVLDPRDPMGKIVAGEEFLAVFDGATGALAELVEYAPARGPELASWGADPRNDPTNDADFANRYVAAVAYLDGVHPSIITGRGYFARTALAAWDYSVVRGTPRLELRWTFDSAEYGESPNPYEGQGNTQIVAADIDGDGNDEIVHGSLVIDEHGEPVYVTGWGGGSAMHVGDLDPREQSPGLEVFNVHGRPSDHIVNFRSASDGKPLWIKASPDGGPAPGQALAADVDPTHLGAELWVAGPDQNWDPEDEATERAVFDVDGNIIGYDPPSTNFAIWWDGDLLRELLDGTRIDKFELGEPTVELLAPSNCLHTSGVPRMTPVLTADVFGDWREEMICRDWGDLNEFGTQALRIYTTTDPTEHRFVTLMHDPLYRLGVATENVGLNQPPHTSYFLGVGMDPPPTPAVAFPCASGELLPDE